MTTERTFFEECWVPVEPKSCSCPAGSYDRGSVHWPSCPMAGRDELPAPAVDIVGRSYPAEPNRHPLSQAFVDHFHRLVGLHDRKQADYGRDEDPFYNIRQTEQWGIPAWVGALIRLDDKIGRLRNLIQSGGELQNESVEDSLDDIAVYAGIARTLLDELKSARSGQEALS